MLNKKETHVLKSIYELAAGKSTCLIPPNEILKRIPYSVEITRREMEELLKTLEYDGYLELIETDSKGEKVYCITLTTRGMGFNRELINYRRAIYFKLTLTLGMALLGFLVTRILMLL